MSVRDTGSSTMPLSQRMVEGCQRAQGEYRLALLIFHRDGAQLAPLTPGVPVVVGRNQPSDVQILDRSLSRQHARFTLADGVIVVEDLKSTNGTWVRGASVERAEVGPGDEVILGRVAVVVRALAAGEGALPELLSYEQFRMALEGEVVRARHFRRGLGVLLVRGAQRGAYVGRWIGRVRAQIRPVDQVGLYGPEVAAVLLPEADAEVALEIARAIGGGGSSVLEGEPPLCVGVAPFPGAATTAEALLEEGFRALQQASAEEPVQAAPTGARTRNASASAGPSAADTETSPSSSWQASAPVAVSVAMRGVLAAVDRLARSTIPVLLHGETGTGKEVVARALHEQSPRKGRPMVCVNCGAIPESLVESTLFGHERGAFTGATQLQKGVFEAADGGTVFLDEIGELPAGAQAALLRVLETRRVTRVGGSCEFEVDVRLVAASHRDLEAMCASGGFRADLLYRLNAMTLEIPPLRERPEDVAPLALRFLELAAAASGRAIEGIRPGALELLGRHPWPGNARELRNAIERAVVIAEGGWVEEEDLPERVRAGAPAAAGAGPTEPPREPVVAPATAEDLKARVKRYEAELLEAALREAGWNQTEAARRLGMPLRTLVHKLKALGIARPRDAAAGRS